MPNQANLLDQVNMKYVKWGTIVILLLLAVVLIPRIFPEEPPKLPSPEVEKGEPVTKVIYRETEVVVPGSIEVEATTKTYSDGEVWRLIDDIVLGKTWITTLPDGGRLRPASKEEFQGFLKEFKAKVTGPRTSRAAKAQALLGSYFWNNESRKKIGAGHFITDEGRVFILVMIYVGGSPQFAKIDVFSNDPEKDWRLWTKGEEKTNRDKPVGRAKTVEVKSNWG